MDITVVLCTYNRCGSLAKALNSLVESALPQSVEWEVLLVDNNSNDDTPKVSAEFCKRYPRRFRYLFEKEPGLSNARNAGIREAKGHIIVFMDDDVIVEAAWLQNLTATLHNGEWAGAGGRILPEWNCSPPRWLSPEGRHAAGPLVAFHPFPEAGQLNEPPIGANMAFRKEMFEKYGGFRTDLGRRPDSLMSNEDTEFGRRLLSAGERLRYEPSALVYHPVQENRIKKEYFLAWWFNKARADMRVNGVPPGTKYYVAGIPLYLFRRLTVWTLRWMIAIDSARRFTSKLNAWGNAGEILECYQQSQLAGKRTRDCRA